MAYTLCIYYSRTGHTEKLMKEIAQELQCEAVKLEDGVDRTGAVGWLRSGMQAMARKLPPVKPIKSMLPLSVYDLVIIGTPVWAGRCSAPVRSFLRDYGEQIRRAAYVLTRASDVRYEEVYEQMDFYLRMPHSQAVTIRPGSVGADFWRDSFVKAVQGGGKDRDGDAG